MRHIILRRLVCSLVIASGCATGEMHRVAGDGGDGPGEGGTEDDASSSDPSGTPGTQGGEESGSDDDDTDPSVGDSSDSDPSDSDPSDTDPSVGDSSDTDPSDSDPSGEASTGGDESTGDPTDATTTDDSDSDPSTTTDDSETDTDPSATDTAADEPVDLSGYTVVQTDSLREYEIPDGTLVPRGGYLVIGRNASPGAFQDFWGVNWGDDVVYLDTDDGFPTINGAETFTLLAPGGTAVDGPTPLLELSTGATRTDPAMSADDPAAWSVSVSPNQSASPGAGGPDGGTPGVPFISEYVDPTGAGNFVYEFVEVRIAP